MVNTKASGQKPVSYLYGVPKSVDSRINDGLSLV
jgi:hypothetical protein